MRKENTLFRVGAACHDSSLMPLSLDAAATTKSAASQERRYWVLAGVAILLGVALRLWGYFEYEFWYDEAFWASRTLRSVSNSTRPFGYMYLSQFLTKLHNTEPVIRLPSLVAGIASLPLFLLLCRKVRLSWPVSLFGVFVLAIHPWAVTASKEFKPYALELALHLALLALAASYSSSRKTRDLILLGCAGVVSTAFAWTVAMLLPWLFLTLFAVTLRARNKKHAAIVFAGGTLTALSLAAIFFLRLADSSKQRDAGHFGTKYDVFFGGEGWVEHARWLLHNTAEVAAFPALLKLFWRPGDAAQLALNWLHVGAVIAGCVYLMRQRSVLGLAWVGTWATAIVLGALHIWPYGIFRTNLFLLAYSLLLALCGLQYFWDWAGARRSTRRLAAALAVSYVALVFPYRLSEAAEKTTGGYTASIRKSLETIKAYEEAREPRAGGKPRLLLDSLSCAPYKYYTQDHASASVALGEFFTTKMNVTCLGRGTVRARSKMRSSFRKGFWLISSRYVDRLENDVVERCKPDILLHLPGPTLLAHCPRGALNPS